MITVVVEEAKMNTGMAGLGVVLVLLLGACAQSGSRGGSQAIDRWVMDQMQTQIAPAFDRWARNLRLEVRLMDVSPAIIRPQQTVTITVQVLVDGRHHDRSSIVMRWDAERSAYVGTWSLRYGDRLHGRFERSYEADYTFIYGDRPRLVPGLLPPAEASEPVDDAVGDGLGDAVDDPFDDDQDVVDDGS